MKNLLKVAFPIVFFPTIVILAIRYYYWNKNVDSNGVYVIGRRTLLMPGGETGASFRYKFFYKSVEYEVSFVDPYFKYNNVDTLLFFKILPNDPGESFKPIKETTVPKCFSEENVPYGGWKTLPNDTCRY